MSYANSAKSSRIPGIVGTLFLITGALLLLTSRRDIAWTMAMGGSILIACAMILEQLAEIRGRLDVIEDKKPSGPGRDQ